MKNNNKAVGETLRKLSRWVLLLLLCHEIDVGGEGAGKEYVPGCSFLHVAVWWGRLEWVRYLSSHKGKYLLDDVGVRTLDEEGHTPLAVAVDAVLYNWRASVKGSPRNVSLFPRLPSSNTSW